ncbi:hypothetical protein CHCC20375_2294 [Bacillus licheniformis]|nr:hypothetical protein CHCC20375_2294 [Bacillus licheniformis]
MSFIGRRSGRSRVSFSGFLYKKQEITLCCWIQTLRHLDP